MTLQISEPASIKAYFEKVRELAKNGEAFPVSLDDVWPLVYSRKDKAVRVLKSEYIENEDYKVFPFFGENTNALLPHGNIQSRPDSKPFANSGLSLLPQNGEQNRGRGGHNQIVFRLSVSCMEHLIARKHKAVFEVYRQVFHLALNQAENQLAMSQSEVSLHILQQLITVVQGHVDHERRLSHVEQELQLMRSQQQEAARKLLQVARSSEPLPDETVRMKVLRIVNSYCEATNVGQQQAWRQIYDRLYYLYKVNIRGNKRRNGESWLDVAERCGHMDKIYTIASAELNYG